jgi:hypothetical protein
MKGFTVIVLYAFFLQLVHSQSDSIDYFGQAPPGVIPEVFAPGIISTDDTEFGITISPSGDELYFTRTDDAGVTAIYFTKKENSSWTSPAKAPFSNTERNLEPSFSPDGRRIYFTRRKTISTGYIPAGYYVEKNNNIWGEATEIENPLTDVFTMYLGIADNGNIYYTGREEANQFLFFIENQNGTYSSQRKLPPEINYGWVAHSYIAPDESYIIYDARNREDSYGNEDLYISFKDEDGTWSNSINFGGTISTEKSENCPGMSPDGKYLFFMRTSTDSDWSQADIYWVRSDHIIDSLKKEVFTHQSAVQTKVFKKVSVFPNPATGQFDISFSTPVREALVEMYDLQGNLVLFETFYKTASATIHFNGLKTGMYLIKIYTDNKIFNKKIILNNKNSQI